MWASIYSQALTGSNSLGSNYNYVVTIPPITPTKQYIRLALRATTTGNCTIQNMWMGYGQDEQFDGLIEQITVNGLSMFTLNGLTYSDPIDLSNITIDPNKEILLAYELLSGNQYRSNLSAPSTHKLSWKAGTGDADNLNKTGYTTVSGRTAILEAIEEIEDITQEPEPEPEPTDPIDHVDNGYEQVLLGQRHSTGEILQGMPNKHLHIQFRNPVGTGKVGLLYELEITPDADTVVSFRSYPNEIGNAFPVKCNLCFGFGKAKMEGRYAFEDSILGVFHSIHKIKGNQRNIIKLDVPLVALHEGWACVMALHDKGVGGVVNLQWREV